MIQAVFTKGENGFSEIQVSGHAGFDREGRDIVCAAVTSALQMAVNGITEVLGIEAPLTVEENRIHLALPQKTTDAAHAFLEALYLHLDLLRQDYPDNITVTVLEV